MFEKRNGVDVFMQFADLEPRASNFLIFRVPDKSSCLDFFYKKAFV